MTRVSQKMKHRKLGFVPIARELRIRLSGWAKRMTMTDTDGQMPLHEERWETDNPCHSIGEAFRDDINSLQEFDEGDDFVCELNGN